MTSTIACALPTAQRRHFRVPYLSLALGLIAGTAWATQGESYPGTNDAGLAQAVAGWQQRIPGSPVANPGTDVCTGTVTPGGGTFWQDRKDPFATPLNGPWSPATTYNGKGKVTDLGSGNAGIDFKGGGDTDVAGTDSYALIKLVGIRANLFLTVLIECEDDADFEWSIRWQGQETLDYVNGDVLWGQSLSISNHAEIDWRRRIVDFDSKNQEYDETKRIVQKWSSSCFLIDGSAIFDGTYFERHVPGSSTTGFSVSLGLNAEIGAKRVGKKIKVPEGGAGVGVNIGWETSSTNEHWTELNEAVGGTQHPMVTADVTLTGIAPCPTTHGWFCKTIFDGEFSINDHESFNGSLRSRQELTVKILNYIHDFTVTGCLACGTPPPPPPPSGPPPPTTPPESTPPTTGGGRVTTPTPPAAPPPTGKRSAAYQPSGQERDTDGDGNPDGILCGPVGDVPGGWCGTPYFFGVAHQGTNHEAGYQSIERWTIGDVGSSERLVSAIADPWGALNGTRALVVVKSTDSGICRLDEVQRGSALGLFDEEWPDRVATVPCSKYSSSVVKTRDLSALHPTEAVSGGVLVESTIEGARAVVLHVLVVRQQEASEAGIDDLEGHVVVASYVVTRSGSGDLILTELEESED